MINKVTVALFIALMQAAASIVVAEPHDELARVSKELKAVDRANVARIEELKLEKRALVRAIAGIEDNSVIINSVDAAVLQTPLVAVEAGTGGIILKSKINAVFKSFIDSQRLEGQNLVQAQTMELHYTQLFAKFDAADVETRQQIKTKIITFTEAARLLRGKLQLLSVRPNFVKLYFGSVQLGLVDEHSLDNVFTSALHNVYRSQALKDSVLAVKQEAEDGKKDILLMKNFIYAQVNDVVTDALGATLLREEIIDLTFGCLGRQIKLKQHPIYRVISVVFSENFMDLIQQYFDLEATFKAAPTVNLLTQNTVLKRFADQADVLMAGFLPHTQTVTDLVENGMSAWASLFISKIILLKRSFIVRLQTTKGMLADKMSQAIYFKHSMLLQDPQFNEATMLPSLRTYVSRYENLVMRFLANQIPSELDFYCEHYALLGHLRSLVAKVAPSDIYSWRTYILPRSGAGLYVATINSMIEVLEIIEKTLKNDDGIITATQNFLAGLLPGNAGVAPGNQAGITADQLKSILSGGGNAKDTMVRLATSFSPLFLNALMNWNNGGAAPVALQAPELVTATKKKDLGSFGLLAQQNPELAQKIQDGVPTFLASIMDSK